MRRKRLVIVYKSGAIVKVRAKRIKVLRRADRVVEMEWEDMRPSPLLAGIDEIAAVYAHTTWWGR